MNDPQFDARLSVESKSELLYLFSYIEKFNNQVVLRFNDDGLRIQCTDPAHVSMLNVRIDRSFFTSLIARGEIGVNVGLFHKILDLMVGDTFFEYHAPKLKIFDANTTFEMACFDIDSEQFDFPAEQIAKMIPIEFFENSTVDLVETIKKWTSKFKTDSVRFQVRGDTLKLSSETMETTIQRNFSIIKSEYNWDTRINTKYFTQLPKTNAIIISFLEEFPLLIDECTKHIEIQTFVAPMLDD